MLTKEWGGPSVGITGASGAPALNERLDMRDDDVIVIVGGGLAGARAAEGARAAGFDGRLVLIGAEDALPYIRPPLSKDFLAGAAQRGQFDVHPVEWYRDERVDLRL